MPLAGKGGEKEKEKGRGMMSNDKGTLGENKNDLTRFDFNRTIDSEGEMLRGRDVPMSQVRTRLLTIKFVIFFLFSIKQISFLNLILLLFKSGITTSGCIAKTIFWAGIRF